MKESITLKPSATNVYLCSWNYGAIVQIHTRKTLYNEYKDTNLFDEYGIDVLGLTDTNLQILINEATKLYIQYYRKNLPIN